MRKYFLAIALVLLTATTAMPGGKKYFDFPFIGKWQPSDDPLVIEDWGLQDVQNMRREGKRIKGVSGHTRINTTDLGNNWTGDAYIKNAFHFQKDEPTETHIITTHDSDQSGTGSSITDNSTAIPDQGNFDSTVLYTEDTAGGVALFSDAPNGNMLACNGAESLIWGGDELRVASLFTCTDTNLANPRDETDAAQNTLSTAGNYFTVGGGNDANTKLLLHSEGIAGGNIADESAGGNGGATHGNATKNGNADITNSYYKFGTGSVTFDGTGDYLSFAQHDDWAQGTGLFTVDFWVQFNSTAASGGFFQNYLDGSNHVQFYWDSGGTLWFRVTDALTADPAMSYPWNPVVGQWYHMAVVRGAGGIANRWEMYIDGVGVTGGVTSAADWPNFAGDVWEIGRFGTTGLNGRIDEFRLTKGVARWTSNFTPPDRPYQTDRSYIMVGSTRPLQGITFYVSSPNTTASTLAVSQWTGAAWSLMSHGDGTRPGSISFAGNGLVTFPSTVNSAVPRFFEGEYLYWYKVGLTAGSADIYHVTVDAPMQDVINIWNGVGVQPTQFQVYDASIWEDYSAEVLVEASVDYVTNPIAAELDDLANTEYVYIGFPVPVTGIKWNMMALHENDTASVVTIYYNNGGSWVSVGTVTDETSLGGKSLAQSGWMHWNKRNDGEEFQQNEFGVPGYYYKIMWSLALGTDVLVDTVSGGGGVDIQDGYNFPLMFQERAFLCGQESGEPNKCVYSAFGAPDVWNGWDSGKVYFGGATELVAGCVLYNVFPTAGGIEHAIVCKKNETYRVFGNGPSNWDIDQIDANTGCIAPRSMAVCGVSDTSEKARRNFAIWQAAHGVVMCDGSTIETISDDIKNYWDPNSDDYIPTDRQDDSVGWFDPNLQVYKLLISSGAGQTTHNVELEYSTKYKEWTKLYRENASGANPLQCGFSVHDTDGNAYTYGATNEGYLYRLENGANWNGTPITEYLHTKNVLLDPDLPLWKDTVIDYLRLTFEDKTATYNEDFSFQHYCDGALTVDGTDDQDTPDDVRMDAGPRSTQDVQLGPCLMHSFIITTRQSNDPDGAEWTSMGFIFDSMDTLEVDQ